ncbi:hypothetical protein CDAR_422641, partial [Caerostris darwini]
KRKISPEKRKISPEKRKISPGKRKTSSEKREECSVKESDKSVEKTSPVLYSSDVYMEIFRAYLELFKTKSTRRRLTAFLTERNFDEYFLIYKKDTSLELVPNEELVRWILRACKKSKHVEKQWDLVHKVLNFIDSEVVLKIDPENRKNWIEGENSRDFYFNLLVRRLGSRDAEHKKESSLPLAAEKERPLKNKKKTMKERESSLPGKDFSQVETFQTEKSSSFVIPTEETSLLLAAENERPLKNKKKTMKERKSSLPGKDSQVETSQAQKNPSFIIPTQSSLPLAAENERPLKHKKRKHRHSLKDDNALIKLNEISVTDKSTQSDDVDTSVPIKTSVLPGRHCHVNLIRYDETPEFKKVHLRKPREVSKRTVGRKLVVPGSKRARETEAILMNSDERSIALKSTQISGKYVKKRRETSAPTNIKEKKKSNLRISKKKKSSPSEMGLLSSTTVPNEADEFFIPLQLPSMSSVEDSKSNVREKIRQIQDINGFYQKETQLIAEHTRGRLSFDPSLNTFHPLEQHNYAKTKICEPSREVRGVSKSRHRFLFSTGIDGLEFTTQNVWSGHPRDDDCFFKNLRLPVIFPDVQANDASKDLQYPEIIFQEEYSGLSNKEIKELGWAQFCKRYKSTRKSVRPPVADISEKQSDTEKHLSIPLQAAQATSSSNSQKKNPPKCETAIRSKQEKTKKKTGSDSVKEELRYLQAHVCLDKSLTLAKHIEIEDAVFNR